LVLFGSAEIQGKTTSVPIAAEAIHLKPSTREKYFCCQRINNGSNEKLTLNKHLIIEGKFNGEYFSSNREGKQILYLGAESSKV
jgi:hypothetical protein